MLEQRIQQQFFDSADLKYQAAETLTRPIADAVAAITGCITGGGKLLVCGSGAAAADARHFTTLLVGRFERERPGLAAIALSADGALLGSAGDASDAAQVFAQQVRALGAPGDLLVSIGANDDAPTLVAAVKAAHDKEMAVVALTGRDGGRIKPLLAETDVHIAVPHERAARIHEVHLLALHCICDAVDLQLLGEQDDS